MIKTEEQHRKRKCELHNCYQRLSELGKEAVSELNNILKVGVPSEALATMMATAIKADSATMKECPKDKRRCKW